MLKSLFQVHADIWTSSKTARAQTCFPTASKIDSRYNRKLSLLCLFALSTGSRRASTKCSGPPATALSSMGFNEVNVHRLLFGCHKINFVFVRI